MFYESDIRRIPLVADTLQSGTLDGFDAGEGVAIGEAMARQLGLMTGDNITIISPRGSVTPMGVTPRVKSYPVTAIFKIGMSEYDGTFFVHARWKRPRPISTWTPKRPVSRSM